MSSIALTQLLVLLSLLLWFTATIFSGHHHPVCHLFCRSGTTGSFPYFSTVVDPWEILSSCYIQDGVSQLIHRAPGFGVQKPVSPTLHKTLWPCFIFAFHWKRVVECRGSALEILEQGFSSTEGLLLQDLKVTGLQKLLPSQPSGSQDQLVHSVTAEQHKMQSGLCKIVLTWTNQDFRAVLLKIMGAVGQKPHYFPTLVLLKQRQHLPKCLGVGRAWMRTHRTPYTATQVAVARGNMIWQQLPRKSVSVSCWNIRPSAMFRLRHNTHGSEVTVTRKVRQTVKKRMFQRGQSSSHCGLPGSTLRFPLHCMNRPGLQLKCFKIFEAQWRRQSIAIDFSSIGYVPNVSPTLHKTP